MNKATQFIQVTGFSKRPLNPKKKKSTNFKNLFFIFLIFFIMFMKALLGRKFSQLKTGISRLGIEGNLTK